jgi:tetratricopeptide (TPR) repeat protein
MKKSLLRCIFFLSFCLPASASFANDRGSESYTDFGTAFRLGVESYKEKKFDEAKKAFSAALQFEPNSSATLTNLGLTEYQMGEKGWAVALLRKAHHLDPDFSTPQAALKFILPQLEVKEIPHEISTWENFRGYLVVPVSLFSASIASALFLFAGGWSLLGYLGRRKKSFEEDQAPPAFPLFSAAFVIGFAFFFSIVAAKLWDQNFLRGTIVNTKVSALSLPDEKAPAIFDLYAGLEVILKQKQNDWIQVTYPGGLTGWIPMGSLFPTNGGFN